MTTFTLTPLNDFALTAEMRTPNLVTGKSEPLTSGSVTAFLATTNTQTATAADPSLSVICTHVGRGVWLAHFDASVLPLALLNTLFAGTGFAYCHFVSLNNVRKYVPVVYSATAPAEIP